MIHPKVKALVQEVFSWFGEEEGKRAGEYPEAYLVSLLEEIQERLPEVSAMLDSTVDMARFGFDTERFKNTLAKMQVEEKSQHRVNKGQTKRRRLKKASA
ncbi:MAG: hypothetical protein UX94_C0004G0008 [Parcubacteria group bacterium GW2011_GWA2_47_21]|nr:MAG: hypothetical protein UX94_C0004G0008 [Parcubacteria group bacterium GW2011_GWA2_47_21]